MFFYVETGVQLPWILVTWMKAFIEIWQALMIKYFVIIYNNNLLDKFADRTRKVVDDTADMGWGFNDALSDIYTNFYQQ